MKKRYFIILGFMLILVLLGNVAYSFTRIQAEVGDIAVTSHIQRKIQLFEISFEGMIAVSADVSVENGAMLDLRDIGVHIKAYFTPAGLSEYFIGEGDNSLGDIPSGEKIDYSIEVNATEQIPILAVNDGIIRLEINISGYAQFIPYEFSYASEELVEWDHPIW